MQLVSTTSNQSKLPSSSVLVVYNPASTDGLTIANYYKAARGIPSANLLGITTSTSRAAMTFANFSAQVLSPIQAKIAALGGLWSPSNTGGIRSVAFSAGVPAAALTETGALRSLQWLLMSRYHGQTGNAIDGFTAAAYNAARTGLDYPLCSHLDAMPYPTNGGGVHQGVYSLSAVKGMIDRSVAAQPLDSPILIQHALGSINGTDYTSQNLQSVAACRAAGSPCAYAYKRLLTTPRLLMGMQFAGCYQQGETLYGATYRSDLLTFAPGAIVQATNSYGAVRYVRDDGEDYSHCGCQDFFNAGATCGAQNIGEAGFNWSDPGVWWPAYRGGFTFAEAILRGQSLNPSLVMLVGDPLCAPFAH